MSESKSVEVDKPSPKSEFTVPDDILHSIMEHYTAARLHELENCADDVHRYRRRDHGPEWPVLPILLSGKRMSDILLPKLYRHSILLHDRIIEGFLDRPAYTSYHHVKVLDIVDCVGLRLNDAEAKAMHLLFKHFLATQAERTKPDLDLTQFIETRSDWVQNLRPVIEKLRLRERAIQSPLALLIL